MPDVSRLLELKFEKDYFAVPLNLSDNKNQGNNDVLDNFIHRRARILNTKLQVITFEILERFRLKALNMRNLEKDESIVSDLIHPYHINSQQEKSAFYERLLDIHKERREQEVNCWCDLVPVVRDLLNTWDAHQQTQSRAILLQNRIRRGA